MMYKASLDTLAKCITIAITILFALLIGKQYEMIHMIGRTIPIYTIIACLLIYFLAFGFRPVNYTVTGEELVIHRPFLDVKIKRAAIKSVQPIDEKLISGSFRTFSVGGLFGYFGKYANASVGTMTWYATRRDKPVLITTTDNKKIIVTPDDTENFIAAFSSSTHAGI